MKGLKLFQNKLCPFCQRVAIVARERNIPLEEVEVPLGDAMPKWFEEMNPRGTVPLLQVNEKKYIFESDLIAQYLDGISSPPNALMGSTPYQRHRVEFLLSQVGDLISAYFSLLGDPFNVEKRKWVDDSSVYIENIIAEYQVNGPYVLDDTFSIADAMIIPFLVQFHPVLSYYAAYDIFLKAPTLKKLYAAAMKRPSVKETTLKPEDYIASFKKKVPSTHATWSLAPGYILFVNSECPFADRPRLACALKNIDLPTFEIDLSNVPPWYPWVNLRESVPTLLTPQGTFVHESQLAVHYIDDEFSQQGPVLLPKEADKSYFVKLVESNVGSLGGSMYSVIFNAQGGEAKETLELAAEELEKLMRENPFGKGPFFGGEEMNAADVCLLPMLVRIKACTPELTGGYDLFAKHKLLAAHVEAGLNTDAGKKVFKPLSEYLKVYKQKFRPSSSC